MRKKFNSGLVELIKRLAAGTYPAAALKHRERKKIAGYIFRQNPNITFEYIGEIVGVSSAQAAKLVRESFQDAEWEDNSRNRNFLSENDIRERYYERKLADAGDFAGAWLVWQRSAELKIKIGIYEEAPKRIIFNNVNMSSGPSADEVEKQFKRFFDEHGLVSVPELAAVLGNDNGAGGNGHRRRRALPAPVIPASLAPPIAPPCSDAIHPPGEKRISGEGEGDKSKD